MVSLLFSLVVPAFHAGRIVKDHSTNFLYSSGVFKQSPEAEALHQDPGLKDFFESQNIEDKNIKFFSSTSEKVEVISSKKRNTSSIFINPLINDQLPNAGKFLIKRATYFVHNDPHHQHYLRAISSLAIAIITGIFLSVFAALAITIAADKVIHVIYNQYHERRADRFIVKNATDRELIEAVIYFKALKHFNLLNKNLSSWKSTFIIGSENLLDIANPSIASKISKAVDELRRRKEINPSSYDIKKMDAKEKQSYEKQIQTLGGDLFASKNQRYAHYLMAPNAPQNVLALVEPPRLQEQQQSTERPPAYDQLPKSSDATENPPQSNAQKLEQPPVPSVNKKSAKPTEEPVAPVGKSTRPPAPLENPSPVNQLLTRLHKLVTPSHQD